MNRKLSVLIGRMQPPHLGHIKLIEHMLQNSDNVLVLLGSSLRSRDTKNPFRWEKRAYMAGMAVLPRDRVAYGGRSDRNQKFVQFSFGEKKTLTFAPLKDYPYANTRWQYQVQKIVEDHADRCNLDEIDLYGNYKDNSSWYLSLFPRWNRVECPFFKIDNRMLSASDIRDRILRGTARPEDFSDLIGNNAVASMNQWLTSEEGQRLQEEAAWIDNFKKPYADLPYGIIFQTADNVITWRGLVLLGQRRGNPGRGLWALPGGYVNQYEWIAKGAFRELGEEARTRVYLHGRNGRRRLKFDESWMVGSKTYDYPGRSQRGRVITTRYHWQIPDHLDVVHEAADDLQRTQFFPIHDVLDKMDYELFEDHQQIIGDTVLRY